MGAPELGVVGRTVYRHLLRRRAAAASAALLPAQRAAGACIVLACHRAPEGARAAACSALLFDRRPVLKALIGPDFVKLPKPLEAVVNVFLSGASLYVPAPLLPRSVAQAVRDAFRFPARPRLWSRE